jgi:hypothetical protein
MIKTLPNWAELFGNLELCDCEHCRSVLSPAAYFVDLLHFLQRGSKNTSGKSPYEVLTEIYRPDLPHIKLSCENTNTPIPYIDLVNEILEYYVARGILDREVAYDTGETSAEELSANAQSYGNKPFHRAYEKLASVVFPVSLPYHQPLHAMRIYLTHLGTSRAELMKAFSSVPGVLTNALVAEELRLAPLDWEVFTGKMLDASQANSTIQPAELYGYDAAAASTWAKEVIKVPTFLDRTRLDYTELISLLRTRAANPAYPAGESNVALLERLPIDIATLDRLASSNSPPFAVTAIPPPTLDLLSKANIKPNEFVDWANRNYAALGTLLLLDSPDSTCDLDKTTIKHLDQTKDVSDTELLTLQKLVRLYRKLGWTIGELDVAVRTLGSSVIDEALLRRIAIANELLAIGSNRKEVLAILGGLDVGPADSLYAQIFLSRAVLDIDTVFQPDASGAVLSPSSPGVQVADHIPALRQALRQSEADLDMIRKDAGLDAPTANLDLTGLSTIYRYSALARLLGMSMRQLIAFRALSRFPAVNLASPEDLREFAMDAQTIKEAGWTSDTLDFLFRHATATGAGASEDPLDEFDLALSLRAGLAAITVDKQLRPDPEGDFTINRLELLYGKEIADHTAQMIRGTAIYSTPLSTAPVWTVIPAVLGPRISYEGKQLRIRGPLSGDEANQLTTAAGADVVLKSAIDSLEEMPRRLIKETLTAFLPDSLDAIAHLIDAPAGGLPSDVAAKFSYLMERLLPYVRQRLAQSLVQDAIAQTLNVDRTIAVALLDTCKSADGKGSLSDDFRIVGDSDIAKAEFGSGWDGWLIPLFNEEYTLTMKADQAVELTLSDRAAPLALANVAPKYALATLANQGSKSIPIPLTAGRAYRLVVKSAATAASRITIEWSSKSIPPQLIAGERLIPYEPVDTVAVATRLLRKVVQFVTRFRLSEDEIRLLAKLSETSALFDRTKIPVSASARSNATAAQLFSQWKTLVRYAAVRDALPDGAMTLKTLLHEGAKPALPPDPMLVKAYATDHPSMSSLVASLGATASQPLSIDLLYRVLQCMKLARRLGTSVTTLIGWGKSYPTFGALIGTTTEGIAQSIKRITKAQYDEKTWLKVAKSLSDVLREGQRTALLDYATAQQGAPFKDASQAFEHFLLDVEMSSCMSTSRIKQAIGAVQLFVQRCLMNLESDVDPSQIDGEQWEWMSHYRVWEANRKIFLYPENWIVGSLRKSKTPQFRELESALMQREITNETAERAFLEYLRKLDEIARLEICGVFNEDRDPVTDEEINRLHVFGRTGPGSPHAYYYRRREPEGVWAPWEAVQLDIQGIEGERSGVHLIPIVWNRQLYLFWPIFSEKASPQQSIDKENPTPPAMHWEVKLAWSVYIDGKWVSKRTSAGALDVTLLRPQNPREWRFLPQIDKKGNLRIACIGRIFEPGNAVLSTTSAGEGAFTFSDCGPVGASVERVQDIKLGAFHQMRVYPMPTTEDYYANFEGHFSGDLELILFTGDYADAKAIRDITAQSSANRTKVLGTTQAPLVINTSFQRRQFTAEDPFFLHDRDGCYLVERISSEWSLLPLSDPNEVVPDPKIESTNLSKGYFNRAKDLPMPVPGLFQQSSTQPWTDARRKLNVLGIGGLKL